jgi:hypothetical protein
VTSRCSRRLERIGQEAYQEPGRFLRDSLNGEAFRAMLTVDGGEVNPAD